MYTTYFFVNKERPNLNVLAVDLFLLSQNRKSKLELDVAMWGAI